MTATDLRPSTRPAAKPAAPRRRWRPKSWRFLRAVVPFAVVVLVFVLTGVAWVANHADPGDRDWLEPGSGAGIGSHRLVAELSRHGDHRIIRYTDTLRAIARAREGNVTLMVTAPDEVYGGYLNVLERLPNNDRVLLVEPSAAVLDALGLDVHPTGGRWTTGVAAPGACRLPEAAAGSAAVIDTRYGTGGDDPAVARCYDGGLVRVAGRPYTDGATGGPEYLIVGAGDVFRNDRQDEHHNQALARALLDPYPTIAWLSLHQPEPAPPPHHHGNTDPLPPNGGDRSPGPPQTSGDGGSDGSGSASGSSGSPPDPLWGAFPAWSWALVVQLLVAAAGLALWRARRLAVPVAEPLPVVVRSAETVSGRGRLYHRAGARQAALDALRAGALARMQPALRSQLAPDAPPEQVVAAVAERSGWTPEQVTAVLYTAMPVDDAGLAAAVDALDALTRAVAT